eukprot:jgi/Ulvmu1/7141/UM034_0047.1
MFTSPGDFPTTYPDPADVSADMPVHGDQQLPRHASRRPDVQADQPLFQTDLPWSHADQSLPPQADVEPTPFPEDPHQPSPYTETAPQPQTSERAAASALDNGHPHTPDPYDVGQRHPDFQSPEFSFDPEPVPAATATVAGPDQLGGSRHQIDVDAYGLEAAPEQLTGSSSIFCNDFPDSGPPDATADEAYTPASPPGPPMVGAGTAGAAIAAASAADTAIEASVLPAPADAASAAGELEGLATPAERPRSWWQRGWSSPAPSPEAPAVSGSAHPDAPSAADGPSEVPAEADSIAAVAPARVPLFASAEDTGAGYEAQDDGTAAAMPMPMPGADPAHVNGNYAMPSQHATAAPPEACDAADASGQGPMHALHSSDAYGADTLGLPAADLPGVDSTQNGFPPVHDDAVLDADGTLAGTYLPPVHGEGASVGAEPVQQQRTAWDTSGQQLLADLHDAAASQHAEALAAEMDAPAAAPPWALGSHENGTHEPSPLLPSMDVGLPAVGSSPTGVIDPAMAFPAPLRVSQPPSAPSSAPGSARMVPSGTGEKARAMQQYVLSLEAERNELQRGLDKQMALVRKLADEQLHADDAVEVAKRDVARLEEELQRCQQDLSAQAAIAADAAQEADGARRAVAEVLEGRRAIAEENIALEEQLLELRNAAAEVQQQRSEMESRIAAVRGEVRAAEARAAAAAERAERDKARLQEDIAALQEGRAGLMARLKEMAARKGGARGADGVVDAGVQTDGAGVHVGEQREVACQASVVEDALDVARRALGEAGEGPEVSAAEEAALRDPVSARIAEEALAEAAAGAGPADVGGLSEAWRALLPPAGWGDSVAATVADTQHSVLDSVHALLDGLAEERAQARAELAERDAQVEALKAALAVVGAEVPQFAAAADSRAAVASAGAVADTASGGSAFVGAQDAGGPVEPAGVAGGLHAEAAGVWGPAQAMAPAAPPPAGAVPEIQPIGASGLYSREEYGASLGSNGAVAQGGLSGVGVGGSNGASGRADSASRGSGTHTPDWEHVERVGTGLSHEGSAAKTPVTCAASPVQDGSPGVHAGPPSSQTTPAKRGWFGGMFGRRTPSPAQARRSILTSD